MDPSLPPTRGLRRLLRCPPPPVRPANAPPGVVAVLLTDGWRWVWVDDDIADAYRNWSWRIQDKRGYVILRRGKERMYLHAAVCQTGDGLEVDHRHGERLHCWRDRLRPSTPSQNASNTQHIAKPPTARSRYFGVRFDTAKRSWRRRICASGVCYHLGFFETQEDAADAYDRAALELHGVDFAKQNHALRPRRRPPASPR